MLIDLSFKAIDFLLPFIHPMKDVLQPYFDFCESIDFTYKRIARSDKSQSPTKKQLNDEIFIDDELKHDILKLSRCSQLSIQCQSTRISIDIYHKEESIEHLIVYLLQTIAFVVNIGHHSVESIHCTLYLLDNLRRLDGDSILDKQEVNGGACRSTDTMAKITLWRKEEILKVMIHELIHGLGYDYKQDTPPIVQHYQQKYSIRSPKMNTFEAYTEIHAELIHSYLLATWMEGPTFDMFQANVGIEREFSRIQASKVLSLPTLDMNRETNVCAYYVIKTELYNDLSVFLQFCKDTNESMIQLTDVSKYLEYLKKLKKITKKNYKLSKLFHMTTRMTCLELDLFRP